jgi:ketosteroid isomerase-like protein
MKTRLLVALVVVGLEIGLALPTFAQQTNIPDPQLREQLLAFVTKYEEAINNGDAPAAAAFFAEDGVLVNDTGPVYGQEAIEKYYAGVFQNVRFSNYIITVDQNFPQIIGKAGDEAWNTGEWSSTVRGQNPGPLERKGYWSVIDAREGDARKIRMLTWNMTPLPPAPAQMNTAPSSGQEQKALDPEVSQKIEAVMMKFVEAYNNRDVATISALHTQDAVEVRAAGGSTRAGTFSGRQAIEKMFAADFVSNPPKARQRARSGVCDRREQYMRDSE